ncbi:ribosome recycling factor domain-containing protein [Pilobolus umbonatus]|nr:ribosome recycling factor domain-containing protein [Pilobolus umbonatus]
MSATRFLKSFTALRVVRSVGIVASRPAITTWQKPVFVTPVRYYAKKSKDNKKKGHAEAAEVDPTEYVRQFDEKQLTERFDHSLNAMKEHLANMNIGRANPALLDSVRVRIENSHFSLKDLAQVTVRDPQTLLITVHDPDYLSAVDKSVREAGLNLNPMVDNKVIKVPFPKPTKEAREKLAKLMHTTAEQTKLKIRSLRQDALKQLKHDSKHQPADDIKRLEKTVQNLTDKYNKNVDETIKTRVKELQS